MQSNNIMLRRKRLLIALVSSVALFSGVLLSRLIRAPLEKVFDLVYRPYLEAIYNFVTNNLGLAFSSVSGQILFFTLGIAPLLLFISAAVYFLLPLLIRPAKDTVSGGYEKQLSALDEVKKNLKSSLDFVADLSSAVQSQQQKYLELKETVDILEEASKESAEGLRKKLEAIALVNRSKEFRTLVVAFVLGFFASLLASAVWQLLWSK